MRRFINLRAMLTVAVCVTVVIFALLLTEINRPAGVVLSVIVFALITSAVIAFCLKNKIKWLRAAMLCMVFCSITLMSFEVTLYTYHSVEPKPDTEYSLSGNIDGVIESYGEISCVTLTDVRIGGKKTRGNTMLLFSDDVAEDYELTVGYNLTVTCKLYAVDIINGNSVDGASYRKNIRYKAYADFSDCIIAPSNPGFLLGLRRTLYDKLVSACGDKYGSVIYCMLSGDKNELDSVTYKTYSLSGIGHVLAVSGLHVGFISAILLYILRKLKFRKHSQIIIVAAVLTFYAVFVGLSASVVRSVIMCLLGMLAYIMGEQKDSLSALCFSYSAILTAQPFLLFEAGFLMSFGAVFGLVLFAGTFSAAMRKIKIPKFIASPLSAALAVHIAVLPITVFFYGVIQTYSLIFNLLVLPIISATFVLVLLVLPFSLLFHTDILLRIAAGGFAVTDILVGAVNHLPFNSIILSPHKSVFLIYPAYFAMSRFFMLRKRKAVVSATLVVICAVVSVAPTFVAMSNGDEIKYSVIPVNSYRDVTSVIVDSSITVIGDMKDSVAVKHTLKSNNIRKIDCIAVNKLTESVGREITNLLYDFEVSKVVCPLSETEADGIAALGNFGSFYIYEESGLQAARPIYALNDIFIGYTYEFAGQPKVLHVRYSSRYDFAPDEIKDSAPIIRCFMYLNDMPDRIYLTNMPSGYLGYTPKNQFSLAEYGDFLYKVQSGKVIKSKSA